MKRAFIVPKWGGLASSDWYPWLRDALEKHNINATVLSMPDPGVPRIESWVPALSNAVGKPDKETCLVGHSMGCQAILRYMEQMRTGELIGGALLVAGFVKTKHGAFTDPKDLEIIRPWEEKPLDFRKIASHCSKFVSVLSDNDPYISTDTAKLFEKELGARSIIMPRAGHFTAKDGYNELHVALNEMLKMMR